MFISEEMMTTEEAKRRHCVRNKGLHYFQCLIYGQSSSGKTNLVYQMVQELMKKHPENKLSISALDLEGGLDFFC